MAENKKQKKINKKDPHEVVVKKEKASKIKKIPLVPSVEEINSRISPQEKQTKKKASLTIEENDFDKKNISEKKKTEPSKILSKQKNDSSVSKNVSIQKKRTSTVSVIKIAKPVSIKKDQNTVSNEKQIKKIRSASRKSSHAYGLDRLPEMKQHKKIIRSLFSKLVLFLLILIFVSGIVYISYVSKKNVSHTSNSDDQKISMQKNVDDLVSRVSRHIIVPSDEQPTIAVITDVATLVASQDFYKNAKNGDRLLIYPKNGVAIIFSEERDVLVNVGPVYLPGKDVSTQSNKNSPADSENSVESKTASANQVPITIEIRNGSGIDGAASELRSVLSKNKLYNVTGVGDAIKNTYKESVVVNVWAPDDSATLKQLLSDLSLDEARTILPDGEKPSNAQVLVILGSASQ